MRGYTMSKDDYTKRLRRIEGQVRGLQRMVDEDTYCVRNAAEADSDAMITEATQAIERLVRS
jgi:DNA-binding FrmR family transcriptional regulator